MTIEIGNELQLVNNEMYVRANERHSAVSANSRTFSKQMIGLVISDQDSPTEIKYEMWNDY